MESKQAWLGVVDLFFLQADAIRYHGTRGQRIREAVGGAAE
jgi:hypothetical protein